MITQSRNFFAVFISPKIDFKELIHFLYFKGILGRGITHNSATITGLSDLEICLCICVIYDSHEGVDVTIPPLKTIVVLRFTGIIFQSRKCKSDASDENWWKKVLEHKGTDSCLIRKLPHEHKLSYLTAPLVLNMYFISKRYEI